MLTLKEPFHLQLFYRRLVGKGQIYCAGGLGSILGRTNTQGLKIIEKVPLL